MADLAEAVRQAVAQVPREHITGLGTMTAVAHAAQLAALQPIDAQAWHEDLNLSGGEFLVNVPRPEPTRIEIHVFVHTEGACSCSPPPK